MRHAIVSSSAVLIALATQPSFAQVAFTPRVSRYYDNVAQRVISDTSRLESDVAAHMTALTEDLQAVLGPSASITSADLDFAVTAPQVEFSLAGASLAIDLRNDRTQLAFTVLAGDGVVQAEQVMRNNLLFGYGPYETSDLMVATGENEFEIDRTDFEFTVQHRLSETFALVGGLRIEESDIVAKISSLVERSDNFNNLLGVLFNGTVNIGLADPFSVTVEGEAVGRAYSLRFGAAAYAPFGNSNLFYVSGLLHWTRETADEGVATGSTSVPGSPEIETVIPLVDETYFGPDISVGYVRRMGERIDFDVRYRVAVYFPEGDSDNPRVNHGMSMGLSFWFGN